MYNQCFDRFGNVLGFVSIRRFGGSPHASPGLGLDYNGKWATVEHLR